MISGATGAMAVVVVSLVSMHGIEYLFPTVILCGLLQIAIGLGRLGKLIRMVPHPVMLGFVNGLAIVIGLAQVNSFQTIKDGKLGFVQGTQLWLMLGLVGLTMAIIWLLPKLTRAVPASLVAILSVTLIAFVMNSDAPSEMNVVATVGDMLKTNSIAASHATPEATAKNNTVTQNEGAPAQQPEQRLSQSEGADTPVKTSGISGGLPQLFFFEYSMVPLNWKTLSIIFPFAIVLCGVGLIESLMTLTLVDEITETRGKGNRECIGQGAANIVCGLFGGMGGCAMIGQSMINVNSGGRGRMSGISAAIFLLLFILVASPLIEQIPLAALIGVMFIVVIGTFEWSSFRIIGKVPRSDALILVTVSGVTVATDLAVAVVVGVIISALVFAWEHAKHIRIDAREDHKGSTVYAVTGPLFFGSAPSFLERFDPKADNDDVVIDFARSRVADHSGLEAIDTLAERYENAGKTLHLVHLSEECRLLLKKAGNLVEVNVIEDPKYFVAEDSLA